MIGLGAYEEFNWTCSLGSEKNLPFGPVVIYDPVVTKPSNLEYKM